MNEALYMTMTNHHEHLANHLAKNILDEIQSGNKVSPTQILQTSMNLLMQAERQLHLEQNPEDKGNGFFERKLGTPMGELSLSVPRDRDGDFRPAILPPLYQRDYEEREALLESLLINGYSPQQIQKTLKALNLHYNPEEIDSLKKHYHQLFEQWQQRELPSDVMGLFIDAYHAEALLNDKVRKVVIYVVIGIDFTGHKSLYGLYIYAGNESKAFWLQTMNQLIQRGAKNPLFIVSDDFSGLKEAINTLYPQAFHQLCFIHMQRNVHKNMGKNDAQAFNQTLQTIKLLNNQEQAEQQFTVLCQQYEANYPFFMQALMSKKSHYLAFLALPQEVRKYFYTTNTVESFNSILEKNRQRMGGFFQSEEALKVNVFLTLRRLHQDKWRNGMPLVKNNLYGIRQLFATRYERLPQDIQHTLT
jgi:transposase-like protein